MPEPTPAPDLTVLSHIELLNAYMVALGTAIRRPVSMIERSDAIRAELLRRLTRAAEPDAGRVTISRGAADRAANALRAAQSIATNRWEGDVPDSVQAVIDADWRAEQEIHAALAQAGAEGS